MKKYVDLLADTPEYEIYSENEVKLSREECIELGVLEKGCGCTKKGCCKSKNKNGESSCCNKKRTSNKCCNIGIIEE